MGGTTLSDVLDEHHDLLEAVAEREELPISRYAKAMLESDGDR